MMPFAGELIAIATVLCWTLSVQFFGSASQKIGATPVNIIRIAIAFVLFSILLFIRDGVILPTDFPPSAWFYLGLSGVIGFFIGDIFLFKALVELGPRMAMLLHSLAAPTAAVIGWLFLKETYLLHQWFGIFITLTGVCLVISESNRKGVQARKLSVKRASWKGVGFGIGAMLGQAVGFVLSKAGMKTAAGYLDAFSATQIRVVAALICFLLFFSVTGRWRQVGDGLKNGRAVSFVAAGAFLGPFLGVSLSLLTLHYLDTGIAATFLSLVPICIIPFSILIHKEYVSPLSILGAFVAMTGIYLLMN